MLVFGCKKKKKSNERMKKILFINMYKYVICTVSHWTSIQCWTIADIFGVSKSQYVIVAVVKQVCKAIDYKLTNKYERNNIECRNDITDDQSTPFNVYRILSTRA